jgi:hypothetical protein|tara:strand:+ start:258 stop:851 length:594 start_codon:yes stop_codon:yes gene_type:complete
MSNKIFVFGYNKTGTVSLSNALQMLGYNVLQIGGKKWWTDLIGNNLHMQRDILSGMDMYDCYIDYPIYEPTVFSHIVDEYPDAKYISLTRSLDGYVDSVLRNKIQNLEEGIIDSWNWLGVGDKEVFRNYPEYQKEWVKDRAQFKHDSNVRFLNKKNIDYLDMNICDDSDSWKKLCKFLDKEIPDVDFPHENESNIKI